MTKDRETKRSKNGAKVEVSRSRVLEIAGAA